MPHFWHLDDDENSAGQDDREVVLAATSVRGSSLVHASQRLRQERAVVLSAVSGGPMSVGGLGFHGFWWYNSVIKTCKCTGDLVVTGTSEWLMTFPSYKGNVMKNSN